MKHSVTRRTFLAGFASLGAAACTKPAAQPTAALASQSAATTPQRPKSAVTIDFTGLAFFQHDPAAAAMNVGLLGHNHETIIVARKTDVDRPGTDLTGEQYQGWNPTDLALNMSELTYWKGTKVAFNLTSSDPLSVKSPLGVFPLTKITKQTPVLNAANCQSLLIFKSGAFAGKRRPHKCGHDTASWNMVKSMTDTDPALTDVKLLDTVEYTDHITDGSFSVDGATVTLKPADVRLWVLQFDSAGIATKNPREIVDCQHYYDLVPGYTGPRVYPRRDSLPADCKKQVDADPIYCTPGASE